MGIPNGWSGYCECEGGARAAQSTCTHPTLTCAEECAALGGPDDDGPAPAPSLPSQCIGWRMTGGCEGHGSREPHGDKGCATTVQRDWSGYCSCGGGVEIAHTNCHHATFTCQEKCDAHAAVANAQAMLPTPGSTSECVGWYQTGGCLASGDREPSGDASCSTIEIGRAHV
jgi:hypothetical protein